MTDITSNVLLNSPVKIDLTLPSHLQLYAVRWTPKSKSSLLEPASEIDPTVDKIYASQKHEYRPLVSKTQILIHKEQMGAM